LGRLALQILRQRQGQRIMTRSGTTSEKDGMTQSATDSQPG